MQLAGWLESRDYQNCMLCDFSSNRSVRGAIVAKVFTINEEFMYFSRNMGNLAIRFKTF